MPINIPAGLPAYGALQDENIFVMSTDRAESQDIRPLRIAILNLMPTKTETEIQLMRLLSNTPLQIDITLTHPSTHIPKNTSSDYLSRFYKGFDEIEKEYFDGMIITGAPLERMRFEDVDFWKEMEHIMDWTDGHVFSTMYICWASMAGLGYRYGIGKDVFDKKLSGVYEYMNTSSNDPLLRGMDDIIRMPQSRFAGPNRDDISACPHLSVAATARNGDPGIVISDKGEVFITGHLEYDANTLAYEYVRDTKAGKNVNVPCNYFPNDDPSFDPPMSWRSAATLLFTNWLNYYVYQQTPYEIGTAYR
ncbi:MAG: homoserine O-succinyltransferase [Candidatus Methanomethylophilaceae archaeon]|nr:homoserine O-succinyltransferase [Candidatus Methanomethylophilaceae archaeon]